MTGDPLSPARSRNGPSPACARAGPPLIEMKQIVKSFKTPAGEFQALKGVDACFYPGEFVSVVGRSGSGKSTLVNMITGIDHPTSGTVRVGDIYVHKLREGKMAVWRGRNLGIVFQFFQLLPMLTLLENTMLPMDFCNKYPPGEREGRAMDLLALVGLEAMAHKLPGEVAGGQQQSAAIARALANDPPILIADEPTGNLDSRTAGSVFQIFDQLVAQKKTILMVTHDQNLAQRTGRMLVIADGELIHEAVSGAFPQLHHGQLLWLSRQLRFCRFDPGEHLPRLGEAGGLGLFLVTAGSVELLVSGPGGVEVPGQVLGPGGALSLLDAPAGRTVAALRAAPGVPLEGLALGSEAFSRWLGETPAARALLEQVSREQAAGAGGPAGGKEALR